VPARDYAAYRAIGKAVRKVEAADATLGPYRRPCPAAAILRDFCGFGDFTTNIARPRTSS
jgi:hypothetical protein